MDTLIFGLQVTLIGIGIVFLGLVVLIGLIKVISLAMAALDGRKKPQPVPQPVKPAPVPVPVVEEAPAADDGALIAVITAAIAAMLDDSSAFVVRKVRRVSNTPAWSKAGREEQIYSRF
ncbi:MAG: OadG family protein [Christensenellaceae bacterium]|nr:OadG family protein [Christensenellaceae bacterium]